MHSTKKIIETRFEECIRLFYEQLPQLNQEAIGAILQNIKSEDLLQYLLDVFQQANIQDQSTPEEAIRKYFQGRVASEIKTWEPSLSSMPEWAQSINEKLQGIIGCNVIHYFDAVCGMKHIAGKYPYGLQSKLVELKRDLKLLSPQYLVPLLYTQFCITACKDEIENEYRSSVSEDFYINGDDIGRYEYTDEYAGFIEVKRDPDLEKCKIWHKFITYSNVGLFKQAIREELLLAVASNVKICVATCLYVLLARSPEELVRKEEVSGNEALLGEKMIGVGSAIGVDKVGEGGVADLSIVLSTADTSVELPAADAPIKPDISMLFRKNRKQYDSGFFLSSLPIADFVKVMHLKNQEAQEKASLRRRMIDSDAGDGAKNEPLSLNDITRNVAGNVFAFGKFARGVSIADASAFQGPEAIILAQQEMRKQFKLQDQSLCAKKEICLSQILPYIGVAWFLQNSISGRLLREMQI